MQKSEDLEEGEICSEDEATNEDNQCIETYNVIERPDVSKFMPSNRQYRSIAAEDIKYSSDEDDSKDSSSDEDSPVKKFRPQNVSKQVNQNSGGYKQDSTWLSTQHKNILKEDKTGKKPNNIWGSVLEEENMAKFVTHLNRNEDINYSERGAESYDYTRSRLDPRLQDNKDESTDSDSDSDEEETGPADLTSKETFGFDIDKKPKKKSVKSRLGKRRNSKSSESNGTDSSGENNMEEDKIKKESKEKTSNKSIKFRLGNKNNPDGMSDMMEVAGQEENSKKKQGTDSDLRDRMSRKRSRNKRNKHKRKDLQDLFNVEVKPMKMGVSVSADMEDMELADTIVDALREPEDKLQLFGHIIDELGAEKTIKLFKATEDIEEMGGLMIQNGWRRRTPGGVFFYLIRSDCDITPEQQSTLFGQHREEFHAKCKSIKKENKRIRKLRKEEEKQSLNAKATDMETNDSCDKDKVKTDDKHCKDHSEEQNRKKSDKTTDKEVHEDDEFDENDEHVNIELS